MALLLAAALAGSSPIIELKSAYEDCVKTQTVRLGVGNTETSETILHAVRSVCQPQWLALHQAQPAVGIPWIDADGENMLNHIRANAEDAAVAALLEARSKRP